MDWIDYFLIPLIKVLVVAGAMILSVPILVLLERWIIGRIQQRPGPNRVGPFGILQTIVDGIKLLLKEDFIPPKADKILFPLAPVFTLAPALVTFSIVPLGPPIAMEIAGRVRQIPLGVTDLPIGILFYFAMTSVAIYGIVLAGWSSNSKYSMLGGIRSTAQLISYELTLALSLIGVLLLSGTFQMREILGSQASHGILSWYVWQQPVGFLAFLIAGFAETNRLPFDLPEGETELGAGFHTEYSSLKFAMFMMAEYLNILTFAGIMTTLFLGGYHGPIPITIDNQWIAALSGLFWFSIKVLFIFFVFVWVRGTYPRLRYDQLMNLGWKVLFPLTILNMMVTAGIIAFGPPWPAVWLFLAGCALIWGVDRVAVRARKRVLGHAA